MNAWKLLAPLWFADVIVLGHKCGARGCSVVATCRSYWPGREPLPQCEHHRSWSAHVAAALGFQLQSAPLPVREWPGPDPMAARFAAMELT